MKEVKELKDVSYELGVMMFNVANETPTGDYDLKSNFERIIAYFGNNVDEDVLIDGFMSESENHQVDGVSIYERAYNDLMM